MIHSILTSTKKNLGLDESYTVYDEDIITLINSAFATLNQLGIGPEDGYQITNATATWDAFFGNNLRYNSIKTYVHLSVKLVFDPPPTSYAQAAVEKQKQELEWRLNVVREQTEWVDPDPTITPVEENVILDGGSP